MRSIRIIAVGDYPLKRLRILADDLHGILGDRFEVAADGLDAEPAFDPRRRQYRSDLILARIAELAAGASPILGVAEVDLFIPVLTFVFGEAQLNGSAALVSSHRLRNEMYGLPADENLLRDRLLKEAMHELGHMFGLLHCYHPTCAMQPSTYAELIDLKSAEYCPTCLAALGRAAL